MTAQTVELKLALPRALVERIIQTAQASRVSVSDVVAATVDHALPAVPDLSPDLLRELPAMLDFSDNALMSALQPDNPASDARLRELTAAGKDRSLTPAEAVELDRLLEINERDVIRRAQALAILRRRGYAVPSPDEVLAGQDDLA
jgi:succinate dehydrogenase flavin-adding protein (antitoxin of CptAB toxin-antitoxin module)